MSLLKDILSDCKVSKIFGEAGIEITGIEIDSRAVKKGFAFIAVKGTVTDGHQFIDKAIKNGAACIVCENLPEQTDAEVTYVQLENTADDLVKIASAFYSFPAKKLNIIGVTGTNGKTTIASLLYQLFNKAGHKSGLISTVAYYVGDKAFKATHTTPNVLALNNLFAQMVNDGCTYCFMEVSSHAIDQKRIAGIEFKGGIFTNLTHDHLDYHKTFKNYLTAKKTFFDELPNTAFALVNVDDKNGRVMLQNTKAKKYTYSFRSDADFKSKAIENHIDGTLIKMDKSEVWIQFSGAFNVSNLTAVYAAAILEGIEKEEVLTILSTLKPVSGRFETIKINDITGIVDYAHTPDALENILKTINDLRSQGQSLITVVGAGGDRDKTKRPIMARLAVINSDKVILTSDNPRTEAPTSIIDDMERGVEPTDKKKILRITDRREAIKTACLFAKKGDVILIAGKGHETYQEINGVRYDFDDKQVFKEQMEIISG
jgi:UDP-N-acetylmuramoyl-L-alanyl-D-glutamate--2,6-diaminopimelate ligase